MGGEEGSLSHRAPMALLNACMVSMTGVVAVRAAVVVVVVIFGVATRVLRGSAMLLGSGDGQCVAAKQRNGLSSMTGVVVGNRRSHAAGERSHRARRDSPFTDAFGSPTSYADGCSSEADDAPCRSLCVLDGDRVNGYSKE